MVVIKEDDYLAHYGILRKSGRYPWGSGNNNATRSKSFLDYVNDLREQGLTDVEIARGVGMSTTQLREARTIANNERKQADIGMAQRLKDKGYSNVAIGERMGINESSVRALLAPGAADKSAVLKSTVDMLRRQVDEKTYLDVGSGTENFIADGIGQSNILGISKEKLNVALAVLRDEGYEVHNVKIPQIGTGLETTTKVLTKPGMTQKDVWLNRDNIKTINEFTEDGGRTFVPTKNHPPISIDPKRIDVKYKGEGGEEADGVIYVRPGVEDISLGKNTYAQVRIKVGDSHYLKGMATYKDDLPDGVDLMFNTNKERTPNKLDALKKLEPDPELPFGSITRPLLKDAGTPNEHVTSAMNIVNTEGDWQKWTKSLSSQVLSKQSPSLAKEQLGITYENRKREYDEIMSLTNPTVKKKLLEDFADGTDSAAVHLKAAGMPRQNWHVILPINSLSPNEVYAPNFRDGERVALIRYPHGGKFEIPELVVNNRNREGRKTIGTSATAAIGIHHKVAERLSGADFDGDTVLVIPNNSGKIKSSPALEGLKNFDPRAQYKAYPGMPELKSDHKGHLMGDVSNLITDMTIRGAPHSDIVRAVKHSMVVIDAEKHHLNYKQSAKDHGIAQLKEKYQGSSRSGASTLISRKKSSVILPEQKLRAQKHGGPVDPVTGKRVYEPTGKTRKTFDGKVVPKTKRYNKLDLTDDAHTLSSGTPMEHLYADHSNRMKALANEARLSALKTPPLKYSPSAKKAYHQEVTSLDAKLALAERNRPLERQAQILANNAVKARRAANPNLSGDTLKKIRFKELEIARKRTGAGMEKIKFTPKEWEAIQAGAISDSKLQQLLAKADMDNVRELATPRVKLLMTPAKTLRAKAMLESGATRAEVASALGVSLTTLDTSMQA